MTEEDKKKWNVHAYLCYNKPRNKTSIESGGHPLKKKLSLWLPVCAWLLFIFIMSATPGDISGEQSGRIVSFVLWLLSLLPGRLDTRVDPEVISFLVRKAAHMTEYAVLFLLTSRALHGEGAKRPGLMAFFLCAAYAATDEFHQGFVDGRGPSPVDVMIDSTGALCGWGLRCIAIKILPKRKSEKG